MAMKVCYTVVNGEVLSENRGGVKRDYLPDTQGNTIGLIDNTQAITDTFSYYPYGEVATRTGTNVTPFQFLGTLGYYRDSASRTYVRARTLNTAQGRWMTQDPIWFEGGDYNLYRYVRNNVITLSDPTGLECPPPNTSGFGRWRECDSIEMEKCQKACNSLAPYNPCVTYVVQFCCVRIRFQRLGVECGCIGVLRNIPGCNDVPKSISCPSQSLA